ASVRFGRGIGRVLAGPEFGDNHSIMALFVYIVGGLFIVLAGAMLFVFHRSRHFGMFLMGITYAASGLLAIALPHWWPLAVGFAAVWVLKLLGLEPDIKPPPETRSDGTGADADRRPS